MLVMNQIVGADGFSIMNNLRLVIIAAIFIAIIVAFFLSRIVRNRGTIKRKYMHKTYPYDDSSSKKRHASSVVDDFYSMEDAIKEEKAGKSTAESGVGIEQESVDDLEKIETDIKDTKEDVATKLEADIQDVRNEITAKTEVLISKIEEGEKDVVNKVKNVIEAKVQEALIKSNDRVSKALQTQRNSTAAVLEKIVESLRTEKAPAAISPSDESEKLVEKKAGFKETEEKENKGTLGTLAGSLVQEALNKINGSISEALRDQRNSTASVLEGLINSLRTEGAPAVIAPPDESEKLVGKNVGFEETEERDLETPEGDKDILGKLASSLQMRERSVGISSSGESKFVAEENILPEKIKEKETPPEAEEEIKAERKEPIEAIASSGEVEEDMQERAVGESADFDIQEFLKEESVGISPFDKSKEGVEEKVEERKPTDAASSEDSEKKGLDIAKGQETKEKEQEKVTGESVDFDIQEFLEELGTPPSEKDVKSERG
jgi:hypothetical protein